MQKQLKMDAIGSTQYDKVLSTLLFIYCLALPFEEALVFSFGGIFKIIGIAVIGWGIVAHFKATIKLRDLSLILPFVLWFFFSFFSVIWSKDRNWWSYFIKLYAAQILLVLVITSYQRFINLEYIKNGVVVGAFIAAGILIFLPSTSVLTADGRRTMIIFGNEFDPNILAAIMMIALIITIDRVFQRNRKTLMLLLAAFILLGLLLTGSRGGLIATVVGVFTYFMLGVKDQNIRRKVLLGVPMMVVLVAIVTTFLPESLIGRFSWKSIFGFDEYNQGSHNRWTIWEYALPLSLNAPLLGYGCGNFFYAIATVYRQCASHNLYILLLIEGGIVGLGMFVAGLCRVFKAACKYKRYATVALLLAVGVISLTLDATTGKFFWVSLAIAVLTLRKRGESV